MGGFRLTGPTHTILSVNTSMMGCLCVPLCIDITAEQEKAFLGKTLMSVVEFHKIFQNKYKKSYHVYEGDETNEKKQVVTYECTAIQRDSSSDDSDYVTSERFD